MENSSRTCEYCVTPHRNRKDNLCIECRETKGYCLKCKLPYKNKVLSLCRDFDKSNNITTKEPEPNNHSLDLNPSCASDDTIPYDDLHIPNLSL